MSNPTGQPSGEPEKDVVTELQNELREMGKQLEAAFRATVESDQAKRIQSELAAGVHPRRRHLGRGPRARDIFAWRRASDSHR